MDPEWSVDELYYGILDELKSKHIQKFRRRVFFKTMVELGLQGGMETAGEMLQKFQSNRKH